MDLIKGTLDVLILKTLSWEPMHGYGISKAIRTSTLDVFRVEEGALYPALRRLEKKGLVSARWGRTETSREAKFYSLTVAGRSHLEHKVGEWGEYVEAMARVLHSAGPDLHSAGPGE